MKIYVASSWRNEHQEGVVALLRAVGHDVYDFKHPEPGNEGFHWSEIDPEWKTWTVEQFSAGLQHQVAADGFRRDEAALDAADCVVLVLPCGRSAHLEAGYAVGRGKLLVVFMPGGEPFKPELMYRWADSIAADTTALLAAVTAIATRVGEQVWRDAGRVR